MEEVREAVKKARARSAPGYSGTSYKVYKKCPKLLKRLWKLLNTAWKKEMIPECWQRAEGCFVPKEEHSTYIKHVCTISLLSVECKIFFSVVSKRLTNYMLANRYLDTSVQKAGAPGVSGCIEHTGVLTQLIREARENKGDPVRSLVRPHKCIRLNAPQSSRRNAETIPRTGEGEDYHKAIL